MKLKDFIFSTLPRPRKSKKKSKKSTDDHTGSVSSPETDDVIIRNHKAQVDITNGNSKSSSKKKKNRTKSVTNAPAHSGYNTTNGIAHNQHIVSTDFTYFSDGNSSPYCNPYGYYSLAKTPSNASESGFEDGHDPYMGQYNSYTCTSTLQQTLQPSAVAGAQPDIVTNSFNTFPRERTRIKTNPWVTTHTNTMTSSIHGQVTDSGTGYMRAKSPYSVTPSSSYNSSHFSDYDNGIVYDTGNHGENCYSYSDGYYGNNSDYLPESSSGSSIAPDSSVPASPVTGHVTYDGTLTADGGRRNGVLEGGDLVINLNTGDIFVKHQEPDFSPTSFHYEEDLDATLERDNSRRKTQCRRQRTDDQCYYLTQEDLGSSNLDDMGQECCSSGDEYIMDLTGHHVGNGSDNGEDREGTLTRDTSAPQWSYQSSSSQAFRKRGLKPRKTRMEARLQQDVVMPSVYSPYRDMHDSYHGDTESTGEAARCCYGDDMEDNVFHQREGTDSAYDSSTLSSLAGSSKPRQHSDHALDRNRRLPKSLPGVCSRATRSQGSESPNQRSLEEIHISLKDKVDRLKAEKRIVDQKVQQAREEEVLRREEKARIEQEVASVRKQVLLQTLHDLKDNLQDQSARLQEAYDDVLDMQWINAKLRRLRNTTL